MRYAPKELIVTDTDLQRLQPVIEQHDTPLGAALENELQRAVVVAQRDVPADVVTMNSQVVYEDGKTGARRTVTVVYPRDADAAEGRVSVLAPIGAALLGLRVGQAIEWQVPGGTRCVRVLEVRYQPEASGEYER